MTISDSFSRLLLLYELSRKDFYNLSKYPYNLSYETIREVMLEFLAIVETKITKEMKTRKGAIMYDGWSHEGPYLVGIFVVNVIFNKNRGIRLQNKGSYVLFLFL